MKNIVFYYSNINSIGGIETWLYDISKLYSNDYDFELIYDKSDDKQLQRLKKMIRCTKYNNEQIECEKLIYCFSDKILDNTKAKEYILFIHADYKAQDLHIKIHPKTTSIYAVSKLAADTFTETHKDQLDKLKVEVAYNPLYLEKPKRVLNLISATRLTKEKGGDRLVALAKRMSDRQIPFNWPVFTCTPLRDSIDGLVFRKPTLEIIDYIKNADYLVQLSDTESYAYSIVEALAVGTPVVITPLPIKDEMKCNEGNSIILDFDLKNIDEVIDKMYNNNLKGFKYIPNQSDKEYLKILGKKSKPKYKEEMKSMYLVEALPIWEDKSIVAADLKKIPKEGEQWTINWNRLQVLLEDNDYKKPLVKVVKEIK